MYIKCTQKLLARLKMPHGELPNPPDPLYCWHANYFEYRDLISVVMINDETGEELIFPVDSFQNFDKQIQQEMELDMEEVGIPSEDIRLYMLEAGPLTFGPTSDRPAIAQLNGYARRMKNLIEKMYQLKDILEEESEADTFAESGKNTKTKATSKPRGKDDSTLIITPMVELDVELHLLGDKKVERSFLVPLHITFYTLHMILQIGFGWHDSHLHGFSLHQGRVKIGQNLKHMDIGNDEDILDESLMLLSDFIPHERSIGYLYDFGDSWNHTIRVGKIKSVDGIPFARCTGGYGSTPVEDCGGALGYEQLCAILSDPNHEQYEHMFEWTGDDFHAGFDQDFINQELGQLEFILLPDNF